MKTKIVLAVLIVLFVLGFVFFLRLGQQGYQENEESQDNLPSNNQAATTSPEINNDQQADSDNQPNQDSGKISLSELAEHNSLENCWIAYDGKVYDITSYLPRHPGTPEKILPYCGSADEFEQAFTKKHGTSKVGLLMKVGTFIGDFDVMGNLASPNQGNAATNTKYLDYDDDIEDDEDETEEDD
jgi:cytochrome b involved in lipid metabolism